MSDNLTPTASLETVSSYLPALVLQRFATTPSLPTEPTSEHFSAAVLFADISGFTTLTEKLAEQGAAGTERLTQIINDYFSQLISLIHAHGGDVVKFAGDALVALWQVAEEDLKTVTHRAAVCSLAIQDRLKHYHSPLSSAPLSSRYSAAPLHSNSTNNFTLSLHVSLGAGEIVALHLGGIFGRWELLITGNPLVQVGLADKQAKPTEVLVSPQAWEYLQSVAQGEVRKQGFVRLLNIQPLPLRPLVLPPLPPEAEAVAWSCIPRAVLNRLRSGQSQWLAELRCLTVLFINLPDLNEKTPATMAQKGMQVLQKSLYHYEGSINKLNVDDKGTTLIAALGLPPLSHEDDAHRGTQAALTIQQRLRELNWTCAIGVATGRVFCGAVGSLLRREYTMLGDTVNLAARLMQAAPNQILCDAATYHATHHEIRYENLPPLTVKGKADPLFVYRPKGVKTIITPRRHTTLIGRAHEIQCFAHHLQNLQHGHSGIIFLEGEAGIGKSRLVTELLGMAQDAQLPTLVGAGGAIEKHTPYYAWRPIFRQLLQMDSVNEDTIKLQQAQLSKLMKQLGTGLSGYAPLLNVVLPWELSENTLTASLTAEERLKYLSDLFIELLQKMVPGILVIEDAQWLDAASWQLLNQLQQCLQPLLLVIVTRPVTTAVTADYQALHYHTQTHILSLDSLSLEDTITLVCQRLGVRHLPEAVIRLIEDKAQGHPLFSEELAYALRDSGLLRIHNYECQLVSTGKELPSFTFPETVQGMIASRIDRLTPEQQLTLKVASVIGRVFSFKLLQAIYPIEAERPTLLSQVETLKELDITPLETPPPELTYRFKHAIIQEVTYNLMLFSQRRELHHHIAQWYENAYQADLSPVYPLLAHHFSQAEVPQKALEYAEKAGRQASYRHANHEAVRFFNQAITLSYGHEHLHDDLRHAQWERELGDAYIGLGQLTKGRQHLHHALQLLGCPLPQHRLSRFLSLTQYSLFHWCPALFPFFAAPPNPQEIANIYERLAQLAYYDQNAQAFWQASLNLLKFAKQISPDEGFLARGYATWSLALLFSSQPRFATRYFRKTQTAIATMKSPSQRAWVSQQQGMFYLITGELEQAFLTFQQTLETAQQVGDTRRCEEVLLYLSLLTLHRGQLPESLKYAEEVYLLAKQRGDIQAQHWGLCGQAINYLRFGDLEKADQNLQKAQTLFASDEVITTEEIWRHGLLAKVRWEQGQVTMAGEEAQSAITWIKQSSPLNFCCLEGYAATTEVYLSLCEHGDSTVEPPIKLARQACQHLQQYAKIFVLARPRAWLWQGRYARLLGHHRQAVKYWQKSLALAKQLRLPYEQELVGRFER